MEKEVQCRSILFWRKCLLHSQRRWRLFVNTRTCHGEDMPAITMAPWMPVLAVVLFSNLRTEQIKITTQQKTPAKTGQPRPLGEAVTLAILSTIKGNQLLSSMLLSPKFCLMMLVEPWAWCIWTAQQAKHKNCEHVRKWSSLEELLTPHICFK